jgi:hypothetical protein
VFLFDEMFAFSSSPERGHRIRGSFEKPFADAKRALEGASVPTIVGFTHRVSEVASICGTKKSEKRIRLGDDANDALHLGQFQNERRCCRRTHSSAEAVFPMVEARKQVEAWLRSLKVQGTLKTRRLPR